MELHYKTTVDNEEWEVSSVEVDGLEKLRDLKRVLIDENEWGDAAKVSFYRIVNNNTSKQLALTTKISVVLTGNNEESPLIVIVSLSKQQDHPPLQSEELLRGLKRQLENIQEHFGRPTPIDTPASLGRKSMVELQMSALVSRLDDESSSHNPSLPAVLDDDSIQRLSQLTNEHQVVAFLTPVFEEILQRVPSVDVVNSEEYPWLVTTSDDSRFNQKPDNIFCHSAIYNRRSPFPTEDDELIRLRRPGDNYGVLADWALRDSIDVIGEAKMKIDHAAFGEVINYARHVCYRNDAPKRTKILLYDKYEFWMVRATLGEISSVNICQWASLGSVQNLVSFFQEGRSPWVRLLVAACDHWNLEVQNDAFMGKGTFGRVFRATYQGEGGRRIIKALKLVLPGDNGAGGLDLFREKESLVKAAKVLPNTVARVDGFHDFGNMGAALLLADIGSKVPPAQWRQLFETLGALHQQNILHGDPRLANAIYVQREVRWIDFRNSVVAIDAASVSSKRRDIAILVKSCCDKLNSTMGTDVEDVVREYDGTAPSAVLLYDVLKSS